MPTYKITDPESGKVMRVTGDSPPTESELNDIFKSVKTTSSIVPRGTETKVPEWGRKNPTLYGIAGAAYETGKPLAEATGLIGGAALGGGPASPATAALGAGLGYSGARRAISAAGEALGVEKPRSIGQAATEAATDVPTGAAMEAGGQLVGKGISSVVEKLKSAAPGLYESAMKPSTTLKESVRQQRVQTALKEGIPVSKSGLEKSKATIQEINNHVKQKIADATGVMVSRDRALIPIGKLSEKVQATKIDPDSDLIHIADYVEKLKTAQPEQISIQKAQIYKQTLNKELNQYYADFSRGKITPPQIYAKTKAAMADGLRSEISDAFPELKSMNAKEGSLIELNKSLERAVNRIRNREIIPLIVGMTMGTSPTHSVIKALMLKAVEHPEVKSRLAIALYKASTSAAGSFAKAGTQAGLLSFNNIKIPDVVSSAEAAEGSVVQRGKGLVGSRQRQIEEASGDIQGVEAPAPSVIKGSSRNISTEEAMSKADRMILEMQRNKQLQEQGGKKRAYIPVTQFTYHGPDGDEIRYRDKKGNVYLNDPNE